MKDKTKHIEVSAATPMMFDGWGNDSAIQPVYYRHAQAIMMFWTLQYGRFCVENDD